MIVLYFYLFASAAHRHLRYHVVDEILTIEMKTVIFTVTAEQASERPVRRHPQEQKNVSTSRSVF